MHVPSAGVHSTPTEHAPSCRAYRSRRGTRGKLGLLLGEAGERPSVARRHASAEFLVVRRAGHALGGSPVLLLLRLLLRQCNCAEQRQHNGESERNGVNHAHGGVPDKTCPIRPEGRDDASLPISATAVRKARQDRDGSACMTADELQAYLVGEFPQAFGPGQAHRIEGAGEGRHWYGWRRTTSICAPAGTVSGPALMGLADIAAYAAILTAIGEVPLAVTTSFSINFLRKPAPGAILAEARLLKLGKRLAVCEVEVRSAGEDELCAHAVATYSIPETGLSERQYNT